jgi:hypothetical protein
MGDADVTRAFDTYLREGREYRCAVRWISARVVFSMPEFLIPLLVPSMGLWSWVQLFTEEEAALSKRHRVSAVRPRIHS